MKKFAVFTLFACLFVVAPGCGGEQGGSVTENADLSEVDRMRAEDAAMDAEMKANEEAEGE